MNWQVTVGVGRMANCLSLSGALITITDTTISDPNHNGCNQSDQYVT